MEGFRLSPQQKHLWLLQQDNPAYRAQCALLLEGDLKLEVLKEALQRVINRHEILRTTLQRVAGMNVPFQVIAGSSTPSWDSADLSDWELQKQESKIEELLQEERRRPFDFEREPPLRISLLTLSAHKHVLLLTLPSLCADAWTLKNLVHEISRFYAADLEGDEPPDEPLQYADFSEWQNELLETDDEMAERARAYWRKQEFAGLPAVTLPFEVRSNEAVFEHDLLAFEIDPDTLAKIEEIVRKRETSEPVFLLACWQTLLWRLAGQSEIVVSTAYDGRKYEELEGALGLFAKWLPVRCHFDANFQFSEVLKQSGDATRNAYDWQEYFAWEQSVGSTEDVLNRAVGFEFEERARRHLSAGVWFSVYRQRSCIERFKLKLSCVRADDSLTVEIHYDTSVFQRENVKRIARHFEALVRSAVQNPEAPVSELEILSASERQQLLIAFNQTSAEYPKDKCIHDLFEEQVERTPEAVAVVFEDQQLTYAECNARANQLARVLRQRGVAPDVRVGLCVERSVEMLVGLLGILKAGGAYVPLNPEHPKARLSQQLADIGSPVLITQEKLLSQLPDFEGEFICLDRDQELFESEQKTNPERIAAPHHLVYVIYTSGSTGVPKGVAISHRSLVNYTNFICRKLQLDGSSNADGLHFATVSTIGADLGNTCIFPSLVSGGCLHIIDYAVAMDGGAFANYVAKHPVDVLKIVPSHLSALLASPKSRNILPRKYLILGGEVLSWELIKQVSEISGDCQVINHYGPTETTVGSLTFDLRENDVFAQASTVPIGRPIANTEVYILDPHFKPMPIGVPGQLYISGVGLAQGYLNQPHQTAERFVPHPFSHEGSARLYKTGDLARYLPDGNVEFLGRTDHQVKIRGFRIELGEIEAVLKQHEAVRETVVLVREDEPGQERLVAYVVAHRKNASTVSELRSFLKEKLPEYMLPAAFVVLDGLPLTPNGKVDRKALPAPEDIRLELEATHVAPRTELEQNIAAVWQEALHVEKVGIHDSFFDLGGHSLLMVKVHNKLRGAMNKELSIIDMFRYPTVSSLASYLSGELNEEASSQAGHDRTETRRDLIKQQRQFRQERWQRKG